MNFMDDTQNPAEEPEVAAPAADEPATEAAE